MSQKNQNPLPASTGPESIDESGFFTKIRKVAGKIPFSRDIVAMYYTMRDPETPTWVKTMVAGAIAYFVLPLDALPDFLAIVGFTDDATIIASTMAAIRNYVKEEHHIQADLFFDNAAGDNLQAPDAETT